jgi:hypothetical protein
VAVQRIAANLKRLKRSLKKTVPNLVTPQGGTAKYLGICLDRRLTWRTHIFAKRKQLLLKFQQMYWIPGRKSELSIENKLLMYKTILKPMWTQGAISSSNI